MFCHDRPAQPSRQRPVAARPSRVPPQRLRTPAPISAPPQHQRQASAYAIAKAELEHRLRVPRNYGMTPADVQDLRANFDARLEAHIVAVKRRPA